MKNSKNSQITPMVMEKQKATTAMKKGDKFRDTRSLRLSRSTRAKPIAAHKKPFMV